MNWVGAKDDGWMELGFEDGWGGWWIKSVMMNQASSEDDGWMELGFVDGWRGW